MLVVPRTGASEWIVLATARVHDRTAFGGGMLGDKRARQTRYILYIAIYYILRLYVVICYMSVICYMFVICLVLGGVVRVRLYVI